MDILKNTRVPSVAMVGRWLLLVAMMSGSLAVYAAGPGAPDPNDQPDPGGDSEVSCGDLGNDNAYCRERGNNSSSGWWGSFPEEWSVVPGDHTTYKVRQGCRASDFVGWSTDMRIETGGSCGSHEVSGTISCFMTMTNSLHMNNIRIPEDARKACVIAYEGLDTDRDRARDSIFVQVIRLRQTAKWPKGPMVKGRPVNVSRDARSTGDQRRAGRNVIESTTPSVCSYDSSTDQIIPHETGSCTIEVRVGGYYHWARYEDSKTYTVIDVPPNNRLYVDQKADGAGDGSSWTNAFNSLETALRHANESQIFVAQGVYRISDEHYYSMMLSDNVSIHGGFYGDPEHETEVTHANPILYPTVITGDRGEDDLVNFEGVVLLSDDDDAIQGRNNQHVLYARNVNNVLISGVIITGGDGVGSRARDSGRHGGGLYAANSSITLRDVRFSGNRTVHVGAAIYATGSDTDIQVENSEISGNIAGRDGAVYVSGGARVNIVNSVLHNNLADRRAGAMLVTGNGSELRCDYCTIVDNSATDDGRTAKSILVNGGLLHLARSVVMNTVTHGADGDTWNLQVSGGVFEDGGYNAFGYDGESGTNAQLDSTTMTIAHSDPDAVLNRRPDFDGGNTRTLPLRTNSMLIDWIPNEYCGDVDEDQRGFDRPSVTDGSCDIGSFEFHSTSCVEKGAGNRSAEPGDDRFRMCASTWGSSLDEINRNLEVGITGYALLMLLFIGLVSRSYCRRISMSSPNV